MPKRSFKYGRCGVVAMDVEVSEFLPEARTSQLAVKDPTANGIRVQEVLRRDRFDDR